MLDVGTALYVHMRPRRVDRWSLKVPFVENVCGVVQIGRRGQ